MPILSHFPGGGGKSEKEVWVIQDILPVTGTASDMIDIAASFESNGTKYHRLTCEASSGIEGTLKIKYDDTIVCDGAWAPASDPRRKIIFDKTPSGALLDWLTIFADRTEKNPAIENEVWATVNDVGQQTINAAVSPFDAAKSVQVTVDLSQGTATAADLPSGVVAYSGTTKLVGTIPEVKEGLSQSGSADEVRTLSKEIAMHCTVPKDTLFRAKSGLYVSTKPDSFGDAAAGEVLKGKTFTSAAGLKTEGTIETVSDFRENAKLLEPVLIPMPSIQFKATLPGPAYIGPLGADTRLAVDAIQFGEAKPESVIKGETFSSIWGIKAQGTLERLSSAADKSWAPTPSVETTSNSITLKATTENAGYFSAGDTIKMSVSPADFTEDNTLGNATPDCVAEGKIFTSASGIRQTGTVFTVHSRDNIGLWGEPEFYTGGIMQTASVDMEGGGIFLQNGSEIRFELPVDENFGDAMPEDVIAGKKFTSQDGIGQTGTYVPLDTSDATVTANKLAAGVTAYGKDGKVTGTLVAKQRGSNSSHPNQRVVTGHDDGTVSIYGPFTDSGTIITGEAIMYAPLEDFGDATADKVVKGSAFTSRAGFNVSGTMTNATSGLVTLNGVSSSADSSTFTMKGTPMESMAIGTGTTVQASTSLSNFGDATASDVAAGKTFTSADGFKVAGTMEPGMYMTQKLCTYPTTFLYDSHIAYGNNQFVCVSHYTGACAKSADASQWETFTPSMAVGSNTWLNNSLQNIIFAKNKFVAIGRNNYVYLSDNGMDWTTTPLTGDSSSCADITYGNGRAVIICNSTRDNTEKTTCAYWSDDLITWNAVSMPMQKSWKCITYGNGKFVASWAGYDANDSYDTRGLAYSSDGKEWKIANISTNSVYNLAYGNGKFVAIGSNLAYSTDGVNWTVVSSGVPEDAYWTNIAFGNGIFVIGSHNKGKLAYSQDGLSWTVVGAPLGTVDWADIKFSGDMFIAIPAQLWSGTSSAYIDQYCVSVDGIHWYTKRTVITKNGIDVTEDVRKALNTNG